MTRRTPLKKALWEAWQETINVDYRTQRINSEAGLQACLAARLNLPTKTQKVFFQTPLTVKVGSGEKVYIPDIIICSTQKIIGVVELKYQPKRLPTYKHDLLKLATLASYRGNHELVMTHHRYLGPEPCDTKYEFAKDVLFVWAGVHRKPKSSYQLPDAGLLYKGYEHELKGAFLALHAETSESEHAIAFSKYNRRHIVFEIPCHCKYHRRMLAKKALTFVRAPERLSIPVNKPATYCPAAAISCRPRPELTEQRLTTQPNEGRSWRIPLQRSGLACQLILQAVSRRAIARFGLALNPIFGFRIKLFGNSRHILAQLLECAIAETCPSGIIQRCLIEA